MQASFDPPGITVAVKRDRAVESMLPVGAGFVLNVLADGKDRPVMKRLLKPFKPAEDRFAGMEVRAPPPAACPPIPCACSCCGPSMPADALCCPAQAAAPVQHPVSPCRGPRVNRPPVPLLPALQVLRSEANGAVIIPDAASYLECTVSQRMEAGDHYIVYATVDSGKVLQDNAQVGRRSVLPRPGMWVENAGRQRLWPQRGCAGRAHAGGSDGCSEAGVGTSWIGGWDASMRVEGGVCLECSPSTRRRLAPLPLLAERGALPQDWHILLRQALLRRWKSDACARQHSTATRRPSITSAGWPAKRKCSAIQPCVF